MQTVKQGSPELPHAMGEDTSTEEEDGGVLLEHRNTCLPLGGSVCEQENEVFIEHSLFRESATHCLKDSQASAS